MLGPFVSSPRDASQVLEEILHVSSVWLLSYHGTEVTSPRLEVRRVLRAVPGVELVLHVELLGKSHVAGEVLHAMARWSGVGR